MTPRTGSERAARPPASDDRLPRVPVELEATEESFRRAAESNGGISHDRYTLAGSPLELQFASSLLREQLTPAFAHLAAEPHLVPALTVRLWDSASTQAPPPPHPPVPAEHAEGAFFHFHDPPLRAVYQPGIGSLSVLDLEAGVAWHWVSDARDQPYWEKASPIRQLLFWWLAAQGYLQVHGGAVGTDEGGVLLVGKGGSGKSTASLSALGSPLLYAGDDYVAVRTDPSPAVASLYSSGKLEPAHVNELLPHLLANVSNSDRLESEKAVIYAHRDFPQNTTSGFPLRAVLVPTVQPQRVRSRTTPTSKARAFSALAPSTMIQLHTGGREVFSELSRLIERVPCFVLELGSDVAGIPDTIASLLSELAQRHDA